MKSTIWNLLTILTFIAVLMIWCMVFFVFINPASILNPLPPPTQIPTLALPTLTPTYRQLPATWTPSANGVIVVEPELKPSSTLPPTSTVYVADTFTPTPTNTNTPTNTPTVTNTPTRTNTPTKTSTPTRTPTNTQTLVPTETLTASPTVSDTP